MIAIEEGVLMCPKCGEGYLHHEEMIIRSRVAEDQPGTEYRIEHQRFSGRAIETGFHGRRGDVEILFWCENCSVGPESPEVDPSKRFTLRIWQHKGMTMIEWDPC